MNFSIEELLNKLKEKNKEEDGDLLEQTIFPPEPIAESMIPSLRPECNLLITPMITARFRFAGRWVNATAGLTWLSLADMESAWTDTIAQKAIALRKEHWPTSVLNQYPLDKLALFAMSIDDGNEAYLAFSDAEEPQVVSYIGWSEKRYDSLLAYLSSWTAW